LWELEAVEVVARPRPAAPVTPLETPEKSVFTEEAVDETALRNWLKTNDLAMIVTRNQTSRDRADFMQPFNLQVPGGVKTVSPKGGRVYDISHYQILQADQIRGYNNYSAGRRSIAQPLHEPKATNPANPGGPAGSVKIAADGSTAAFVPARRALAWQTTDAAGNAVVRERVWVTFQPGEVRVCASCHGVNTKDQSGAPPPVNKPEALRDLLRFWKTLPK
jgi:mono/diheme cytochrome c family protein